MTGANKEVANLPYFHKFRDTRKKKNIKYLYMDRGIL